MKRTFNLTEEHEAAVRDSRISQAVHKDIINLMTSSFGREQILCFTMIRSMKLEVFM
jgi:hypothetical protein